MTNADIRLCESILRDFRDLRSALQMRELEIMSGLQSERVDGGEPVPVLQRVMEDEECGRLRRIVESIEAAVRHLTHPQQKAIILLYFVGMDREQAAMKLHCGYNTVRRWCLKGIETIHEELSEHYPEILKWRNRAVGEALRVLEFEP